MTFLADFKEYQLPTAPRRLMKIGDTIESTGIQFHPAIATGMTGANRTFDAANLLKHKKPLAAATALTLGTIPATGVNAVQQAQKTAERAIRIKGAASKLKRGTFGATRGGLTGLLQRRRPVVNALTGGGVTVAEVANKAANKLLPEGRLKSALTKDISTPFRAAVKPRRLLRKITGGLFSKSNFLIDLAEFSYH